MKAKDRITRFVVCVRNDEYPVSLERMKIYRQLPDEEAAALKMVRITDESGEDYLYPSGYFLPIEVAPAIQRAFTRRMPVQPRSSRPAMRVGRTATEPQR